MKKQGAVEFLMFVPLGLCLLLFGIYWLFQVAQTGTEYAEGYTEKAFRTISPGDDLSRVLSLLGEPIKRVPGIPRRHFYWYDEWRVYFIWNDAEELQNREALGDKFDDELLSNVKNQEDMIKLIGPFTSSLIEGEIGDEKKQLLIYGGYNGNHISWKVRQIEIDITTGKVVRRIAYWYRGD